MSSGGKVYLVGAGPGDPGLITLRGSQCLSRADLVLYDYLVNPQILEHANSAAELVCLGRHGEGRILSQEEINRRIVEEAQAGRTVVRLKGGDPAVFAQGAQEAGMLSAAGIFYEIVPGITAALAAGSYAGIPITHSDLASGVALVTGQECRGKETSGLDFDALAAFPGTLVIYMGVTTAPQWTQALLAAGKSAETPAAVIRHCSWPSQQVIRCTLGDISEVLAPGKLRPPAIVILGEVVPLAETIHWFADRPLFGQAILVSRPIDQARQMRDALSELGAEVLVQPAIAISEPDDWKPVDAALGRLAEFDWLVFSSANGVEYFFERLLAQGLDLRQLGAIKIAAIGPATVRKLADYHLLADLQPEEYRAEALAQALSLEASGKRFLLARASRGREVLCEQLTAAGATVEQVVVYSSSDLDAPSPQIAEAMQAGKIGWTTVTSSAIARSLVGMFGQSLNNTSLVSISPITSEVLTDQGYPPAAEAREYTTEGVIQAVLKSIKV